MVRDDELKQIYETAKTIAIAGLSADTSRPSHQVATYLKQHGYRVLPINPKCSVVLNEKCYADLSSAKADLPEGETIDVLDIFRRPENVPPHVDEAIKLGIKTIWMQEGIEHKESAQKAKDAGLLVVMNACMMKEHQRLFGKRVKKYVY